MKKEQSLVSPVSPVQALVEVLLTLVDVGMKVGVSA